MKVVRRTNLSGGDIGVSVHRVLTVEQPCVVVGATSVNIDKSMEAFDDAVALNLSLRAFSLQDILRVRRWDTIASGLVFGTAILGKDVLATARLDVREVVPKMLEHDKPIPGEHSVEMQQVLASLCEEGLAEMKEGTWCATKRACAARLFTWNLSPPLDREVKDDAVPDLVVRKAKPSDPIKDLTLYQLMELLSGEDWQCVVAESKKCVKHMADPYVHNDEHPCVKR